MTRSPRHSALQTLVAAAALALAALAATPVSASELNCGQSSNVEEFRYTWRLRGGVRFIAGLLFPTRGFGSLRTVWPADGSQSIRSTLVVTVPEGREGGFYEYASDIDVRGARTLTTTHAYAWKNKSRTERTVFDYAKRLARMRKETPQKVEDRVKKLPEGNPFFRDILTAIFFLRQNASTIDGPIATDIYSDGKEYPVIFRPAGRRSFVIGGVDTAAEGFEIVDAPGGRKWPGGVKVWLSDDARRIPFRIEVEQSIASVQLDLQSVEQCAFLAQAR